MKKAMIVGLVAVLILALPAVAMAGKGNGKGKGALSGTAAASQVMSRKQLMVCDPELEGECLQYGAMNQLRHTKAVKNTHKVMGASQSAKFGSSQGAIHCEMVIDYNVPGTEGSSGTATLTATRGTQVEVFEALVPWGLSNDEAIALLMEAFGPLVEEAFGLQVNSFKLKSFDFDETTGIAVASFIAIHGEAPISVPGDEGEVEDPDEETDEELEDETDEELDEEVDDESDDETDEDPDDTTTDL